MIYTKEEVLEAYGKCAQFFYRLKDKQLQAIRSIINGHSTVCTLPTGYGKSLCFAAAPIILDQLSPGVRHIMIVISPLKALMANQIDWLKGIGIDAIAIEQSMSSSALQGVRDGKFSIVMLSPELVPSLGKELVKSVVYRTGLMGVTFDEVHCIVQWGNDFRPAYKDSADIVTWTAAPVLCLTATLTTDMRDCVLNTLYLSDRAVETVALPPDRPNIFLEVKTGKDYTEDLQWVIQELGDLRKSMPKTIIYCRSINTVSCIWLHICSSLKERVFHNENKKHDNRMVEQFHSSLSPDCFRYILEEFSKDDSVIRVLVATIGFGMGVDIRDIRRVIHWGASKDFMEYWQEIGRAGRDGQDSTAILYYVPILWKTVHENFRNVILQFLKGEAELCFRKMVLGHVSLVQIGEACPSYTDRCCSFCQKRTS